ncbi:MAG: ribose-phosphate diphosphokinase, partial [Acidimicrobiia bacterium]
HNVSNAHEVSGEVDGRHAIIVDDMIDTAGTVINAAELVRERGALSVRIAATHAILSDPAIDRIKNSPVEEVIVTNTLPVPEDALRLDKIKVLSVASIVSEALHAIFTESSVSEIFLGDNT